jgi:hypothetical protein
VCTYKSPRSCACSPRFASRRDWWQSAPGRVPRVEGLVGAAGVMGIDQQMPRPTRLSRARCRSSVTRSSTWPTAPRRLADRSREGVLAGIKGCIVDLRAWLDDKDFVIDRLPLAIQDRKVIPDVLQKPLGAWHIYSASPARSRPSFTTSSRRSQSTARAQARPVHTQVRHYSASLPPIISRSPRAPATPPPFPRTRQGPRSEVGLGHYSSTNNVP